MLLVLANLLMLTNKVVINDRTIIIVYLSAWMPFLTAVKLYCSTRSQQTLLFFQGQTY